MNNTKIKVDFAAINASINKIISLQGRLNQAIERMSSNIESTTGVVTTSATNIRQKSVDIFGEAKTNLIAAVDAYINYMKSVVATYEKADTGSN